MCARRWRRRATKLLVLMILPILALVDGVRMVLAACGLPDRVSEIGGIFVVMGLVLRALGAGRAPAPSETETETERLERSSVLLELHIQLKLNTASALTSLIQSTLCGIASFGALMVSVTTQIISWPRVALVTISVAILAQALSRSEPVAV